MNVKGAGVRTLLELLTVVEHNSPGILMRADLRLPNGHAWYDPRLAESLIAELSGLEGPLNACAERLATYMACIIRELTLAQLPKNERLTRAAEGLARLCDEAPSPLHSLDPRLERYARGLPGFSGSIQRIADTLLNRTRELTDADALAVRVELLAEAIANAGKITLEEELAEIVASITPRRWADRHLAYVGWDNKRWGPEIGTAERTGVSRQLMSLKKRDIEARLRERPVYAPILAKTEQALHEQAPADDERLGRILTSAGLGGAEMSLKALIHAFNLLGVPSQLMRITIFREHFVSRESEAALVVGVEREMFRIAAHRGFAHIEDLVARVVAAYPGEPADRLSVIARRLVGCSERLSWLDEDEGWLRPISPRNPAVFVIRKVVSVCGAIEMGPLREAITRNYRHAGLPPPRHILARLCETEPTLAINEERASANPPLDWRDTLSETERTFAEVLLQHNGAMVRADLEAECSRTGMPKATFYMYLRNSPILVKHGPGVYGLRGIPIPQDLAGELRPTVRRIRGGVLLRASRTQEGRVTFAYCLSERMARTGTFGIPASFVDLLGGEYQLLWKQPELGDLLVGSVLIEENRGRGLTRLFRLAGAEPGDALELEFDPPSRVAVAMLGEEDDDDDQLGSQEEMGFVDDDDWQDG